MDVIFIMETYYLVDFENVHDDGIANIENMAKSDHVHIFSTENATKIRLTILGLNKDITSHLVPVGKQSLDMHLVSYLGCLLGMHGKGCGYVIVSKDKDYDNIVSFWKKEGYPNISRKEKLPGNTPAQKKTAPTGSKSQGTARTVNSRSNAGMAQGLGGKERSELNSFMQRGLVAKEYDGKTVSSICKVVIKHCNDEKRLIGIHNDLRNIFKEHEYNEVYEDVKSILHEYEYM